MHRVNVLWKIISQNNLLSLVTIRLSFESGRTDIFDNEVFTALKSGFRTDWLRVSRHLVLFFYFLKLRVTDPAAKLLKLKSVQEISNPHIYFYYNIVFYSATAFQSYAARCLF